MSSIASHVHATAGVAASQQPQIAGSAQDTDQDPFEALLDAIAAETNAANSAAAQQGPAANGRPAFNFAARLAQDGNSATTAADDTTASDTAADTAINGTNTAATALEDALASVTKAAGGSPGASDTVTAGAVTVLNTDPASAPKIKGSLAASVKSRLEAIFSAKNGGTSAATASANAANSDNASTATSTGEANTTGDGASGLAAAVRDHLAAATAADGTVNNPATSTADAGAAASQPDTSSKNSDSSATESDATTSASQTQPSMQAIAAAIAVDMPASTTPAAAGASAGMTIGGAGSTRTKPLWALVSGQTDSTAADAGAAGTQKTAAASDNAHTGGAQQTGAGHQAADDASGAATNGNAAQNQPQATGASTQSQTDGGAAAAPAALHADAATAATVTGGSAGAQAGSGNAKADLAGLPNFGIAATNAPSQPAAVAAAATTGAQGTVPVSGLAVAIASRANAGSNQFDIRLDPPELGRIDVRLDVDRNGQVTSHITVDRPDTLQLLQNQQPQLQQALDQAGLKTADNGLQFTLRDQSFAGQNGNGGNSTPQNTAAQLVIPDAGQPAVQSTQAYSRLGLGTGLDIRV